RGQIEEPRMQYKVLPHRQLGVERERLRHEAHAPTRFDIAALDRLSEQQGRTLGRRQESGEHLHGRSLAATVGAQKAEDLAALYAEVDVIDRGEGAEALCKPVGLDGRRSAARLIRSDLRLLVAVREFLRQQLDEGSLERRLVGHASELIRC